MSRVFIVEDHEGVRRTLRSFMISGNHEVVGEATSLEEAKAMLQTFPEDFVQVAIIDGEFPRRGDGEALAQFIREHRPGIKIISLAGQPETFGDRNFLKPPPWAQLLTAIDDLTP